MIYMFRENVRKWFVIAVILVLVVAFLRLADNQVSTGTQTGRDETENTASQTGDNPGIKSIDIFMDLEVPSGHGARPMTIKDSKLIRDILSMIEESKPMEDESEIGKMRAIAIRNNKLIVNKSDGSKREIVFAYDTLYETGYIDEGGKKALPDYSFFRYLMDLDEYTKHDTDIDPRVVQLFARHDWTVDYRVNILKEKLPGNLKHKAGEYPVKVYWAYNNELSKEIGLDFTGYLGKDVTAEIYRLREPLPEFMEPRKDARGIVLKYNDEIIGAYIDAGRHDCFACSLNRKSLTDITGKEWGAWIEAYIDYEDEMEIRLSRMEPEDIIREYFKALDKNDLKMIWACMARENLVQVLSTNLDNNYLYNKQDKVDYNVKCAKLLEIKKMGEFLDRPGILEYQVRVNFDFKQAITSDDGIWPRTILLMKETEKSGWRIWSIGTG